MRLTLGKIIVLKRIAFFLIGFVLALFASLLLSGCSVVVCDRVFPKLTWYWTDEARRCRKTQQEEKRSEQEYQRTNTVGTHVEWYSESLGLRVKDPPSVVPNPALTPGVVDPTVTTEMLRSPAFIKSRRNVPESVKKEVFRRYGIPWSERSHYEVDHYIPLCQGGENSISNLWCEPWDGPFGAHTKDRLEVTLHHRVNKGLMTLKESQDVYLRGPWTNALATYGIAPSGLKNTMFKLTHRPVK